MVFQAQLKKLYLKVDLKQLRFNETIGDERRVVKQIILNFVSNSIKFTITGGILIQCSNDEDFVVISVIDTGVGILQDDISKMFQEYTMLEATQEVNGNGNILI